MDSVPPAVSPRKADDAKVASRQMEQEEVVLEEPQGNPGDPRSIGGKTLQGSQSGVKPDAVSDSTARAHGGQTPSKRSKPSEPATSVQLEAPDNLLEALKGTTINEEHRTVMSTVIQKVQSTRSGLTEACANLLTGFEVRKIYVKLI